MDGTVTNPFVRADGSGNASVSGTFTVGSTLAVTGGANITGALTALAGISSRRPAGGANNDLQVTDSTGATVLFGVGPNASGPGAPGLFVSEAAFLKGGATIGYGSNGLTVNAGLALTLGANLTMATGTFSTGSISFNGATGNGYLPNTLTIAGNGNALNLPSATSVTMPNATLTAAGITFTTRGAVDISALAPFTLTVVSGLTIQVARGDTTTSGGAPFGFVAQSLTLTATGAVQCAGIYATDSNTLSAQYAASEGAVPPSSVAGGRLLYIIYLPANASALLAQSTNPGGTTGYILWDGRLAGNGSGTSGGSGLVTPASVRYAVGGASYADTIRTFISSNALNQNVAGPSATAGQLMVNGGTSSGPVTVVIGGYGVTVNSGPILSNNTLSGSNASGIYTWVWGITSAGLFYHTIQQGTVITLGANETVAARFWWDTATGIQWNTADLSPITGQFGSSAYKPITRKTTPAEYQSTYTIAGSNANTLLGSYGLLGPAALTVFLPTSMRYRADWRAQIYQGATAYTGALALGVDTGPVTTTPTSHATLFYDMGANSYRTVSDFYVSEDTEYLSAGAHTFYLLAGINGSTSSIAVQYPLLTVAFHA